tara:strand:- start:10744 stop:12498 length:1755 start_codon:yes stop_codon:yes gene_type:complete
MEYIPDKVEINNVIDNDNNNIYIGIIVIVIIVIVCFFMNKSDSKQKIPKIIWIYWHEPIEKAPEIVQICIKIVKKLNYDYEINILNQYNYKNFVNDKSIINIMDSNLQNYHKADLLRLYLVYTYGGIYMDASIILFQSFDWLLNTKEVFMYKNIQHTTIYTEPIFENWLIVSVKGNSIIKLLMDTFYNSLINGIEKSYIEYINKNTNYQNFYNSRIKHGPYHLFYFVMIHTLSKNNLHDKIEYLDCNYNKYPCNTFHNNKNLEDLFLKEYSENEYTEIVKNNKFVKLVGTNREYIIKNNIKYKKNSLIDYLLNNHNIIIKKDKNKNNSLNYSEYNNLKVNDLCRIYKNKSFDLLIPGGNKGDGLIYEGLFKYFKDNNNKYDIINDKNKKNEILFICGSGGFSHAYNSMTKYIDLINNYEDIWILPSTFDCSVDIVKHFLLSIDNKKVKIFCREKKSYNDVIDIFNGDVFIDHDTAFNIDYSKWKKRGIGILNAIRLDDEKNNNIINLFQNKKINDISKGNYTEWSTLLNEISKYDEVHTNRAHISIASTLMGKKTFIYPSNYFKQEEIYKYSLSKYQNSKFINI